MIGKTNSGMILGILNVSCPNSSRITVTNGNLSFTNTGTYSSFKLPRTGTWTITATYNGLTETYTRTVNAGQTVSLTVLNNILLYHENSYCQGFTTGFNGWYHDLYDGTNKTYNPVQSNYIQVSASGTHNPVWARTKGSVNLTGIKTVRFGFWAQGSTGNGEGRFGLHVTDGSGNLLAESGWLSYSGVSAQYDLNVKNVNRAAYFQIYAQEWDYGTATMNLYNIWLRS